MSPVLRVVQRKSWKNYPNPSWTSRKNCHNRKKHRQRRQMNTPLSTIVVGATAVHPNKRRLIVSPTQTRVLMRSISSSTTSTSSRRLAIGPRQRLRCDDVPTGPAACQRSSTTFVIATCRSDNGSSPPTHVHER